MRKQRGLSLTTMLVACAVLFVGALVGMKVMPEWIEFGKIKKAVVATAGDGSLREGTVAQVRQAYQKRAEIDDIKSIGPQDLEITKEGSELVISFAYQKKVPLFANVSLVFDFEGASNTK